MIGLIGLLQEPLVFLIVVAAILFGLVAHNVVQALVAASQGDPTASNLGFVGTDPRIHIDPLSLLFLVLLGFAIPRSIPLNPRNIPGRGGREAFVWMMGPVAMVGWAFVLLVAAGVLARFAAAPLDLVVGALGIAATIAIQLAVVFVFPVPPLDGARALMAAGGPEARRFMRQLEGYGPVGFILIFLVLSYTGVLGAVSGAVMALLRTLLGLVGL